MSVQCPIVRGMERPVEAELEWTDRHTEYAQHFVQLQAERICSDTRRFLKGKHPDLDIRNVQCEFSEFRLTGSLNSTTSVVFQYGYFRGEVSVWVVIGNDRWKLSHEIGHASWGPRIGINWWCSTACYKLSDQINDLVKKVSHERVHTT